MNKQRDSLRIPPFLKHRSGRVGQPAVDVAKRLQVEQARSVVRVVKHEARCLEDGSLPCSRRRVGVSKGFDGECDRVCCVERIFFT